MFIISGPTCRVMVAGQLNQVTISPCKVGDSLSFKIDFSTNEIKLYRNFQLEIAFKCDLPLTPGVYYPCVQLGNGVRVNIENVSEDVTAHSSSVSFREKMEIETFSENKEENLENFFGNKKIKRVCFLYW